MRDQQNSPGGLVKTKVFGAQNGQHALEVQLCGEVSANLPDHANLHLHWGFLREKGSFAWTRPEKMSWPMPSWAAEPEAVQTPASAIGKKSWHLSRVHSHSHDAERLCLCSQNGSEPLV